MLIATKRVNSASIGADTPHVTRQLLAGSLFGAVAASLIGGTWFPLQAWWLTWVALGLVWLVREARFYHGLVGALERAGEVRVPWGTAGAADAAWDSLFERGEHGTWNSGSLHNLEPADPEQAAFDALQRASEMVALAQALNDGWIGEGSLAAEADRVAGRVEQFQTGEDAYGDLVEAWAIQQAAEACAQTALELHRERGR